MLAISLERLRINKIVGWHTVQVMNFTSDAGEQHWSKRFLKRQFAFDVLAIVGYTHP